MLRATKPNEKIFSELKEIQEMKFRFQGKCYDLFLLIMFYIMFFF